MATMDSDPEIHYENHCDQTLDNGRKTVKETPIWVRINIVIINYAASTRFLSVEF